MSRKSKEQARIARRDAKRVAQKPRLDSRISRAVSLVSAAAARSADILTSDQLLSHLTQGQRDHIAGVIISVELNETPVDGPGRYVLQNNRCFANARDLTRHDTAHRINYVEGVVEGAVYCGHSHLTHHAWNEIDGVRFDVTAVINQGVLDGSDWTKAIYRGEVITRDQLAERARRRHAAAAQWMAWLEQYKEDIQKALDAFFARYGKKFEEMEFNSDQETAIWEVLWGQIEGYQPHYDADASYFSRAEKFARFRYNNDNNDRAVEWANERLAEMKREMNDDGAPSQDSTQAAETAMSAATA